MAAARSANCRVVIAGELGTCQAVAPGLWYLRQAHQGLAVIRDVGIGVEAVRITDDLGGLAPGQGPEETGADRRALDARAEKVRGTGRHHAQAPGAVGGLQVAPHLGPDGALAGGGREREIRGEGPGGGPVAVEVLGHDQERARRRGGIDRPGLQGGELLRPAMVAGLGTLEDDVRPGDRGGRLDRVGQVAPAADRARHGCP